MQKENYKECHRVSDADNAWLLAYDQQYLEGMTSQSNEDKHEQLGYKYTSDDDWYYQWDRDTKHYYVVVDK